MSYISRILITKSYLTDIGDAIREITATTNNYKLYDIPNIILNADEIASSNPDYLNDISVLEGTCTHYSKSIGQVGKRAFYSCSNLTTVELSKCIRVYPLGFNACSALTDVSLPLCVSIGSFAFGGCTTLSSIYIPKCTYIGSNAFAYCTTLHTINLESAMSVTTLCSNAFSNCTALTNIIVPTSLYSAFKTDSAWANYSSMIFVPDEGSGTAED